MLALTAPTCGFGLLAGTSFVGTTFALSLAARIVAEWQAALPTKKDPCAALLRQPARSMWFVITATSASRML